MTAEELEAAIRAGNLNHCIRLIEAGSEPERRAAAPVAHQWLTAAWDRHLDRTSISAIELPSDANLVARIAKTASVAVAGTATFSELKSLGWRVWHLEEPAWRILAARRVDWLQGWAEWVLGENSRSWIYVRRLVRDGLITKPDKDSYTTAMLGYCWRNSPLELLSLDPELLEDEIWRLFRVEGGGEDSLAARDKYSTEDQSWRYTLLTLCGEGKLSRERLLDESLGALERDFAQFRAGWFSQFHEALSPTVPERAARVDQYLALLASRVPPTVSFALKALSLLDKEGIVPGAALVGQIAPALAAREKGTVKSALRLLDRAARREPTLAAGVAVVACEALLHEAPDVQEAGFTLVQRYGRPEDPELRHLVSARREDLAASQRAAVDAWLGVERSPARPEAPTLDPTLADLEARAQALPAALAELAGVSPALEAARTGSLDLPPLSLTDPRIPRLAAEAALTPITRLDELIDRFAALLESPESPDEIERVLDGVSRLCGERPDDFERRTGPLWQRATKLAQRGRGVPWTGYLPHDLPELAIAWLTGKVASPVLKANKDLTYFLGERMRELAERAAARQPAPLLGTPTHAGGWIDPQVLVERLKGWPASVPYPRFEAIQALLRIAPQGRMEALSACAGLQGELAEALRYALGAEGVTIGNDAALWIAASRARDPHADDPSLEARHPNRGPDTAPVARPELQVERRFYQDGGKEQVYFYAKLAVEPPVPSSVKPDTPTALLYVDTEIEINTLRWLATLWPGGREAWLTKGAWMIGENLDWWEAHRENRVYLEALLDPDTNLQGMGRILLALGLAAKDAGESGLATDALITAVLDGRISGSTLGETLAYLLSLGVDPSPNPEKPGGFINASRWAKTLANVARTSTLHAAVIHQALQRALGGVPSLRPADLAALLELLHELSVSLGAAINDPTTRSYLTGVKSGGRSGKLAQALLALTAKNPPAGADHAASAALAARVERAERWSRSSASS